MTQQLVGFKAAPCNGLCAPKGPHDELGRMIRRMGAERNSFWRRPTRFTRTFRESEKVAHNSIGGKPIINLLSSKRLPWLTGSTRRVKGSGRRRAVEKYAWSRARPAGDDDGSRRAGSAPREVVRLPELPHVHDGLPGDGRDDQRARRQGHDARPRRLQPCVHPRRVVPRRRHPGRAPEIRFFNHNSAKSLERILKTRAGRTRSSWSRVSPSTATRAHRGVRRDLRARRGPLVDDAHGTGTLGTKGTGIVEEMGLHGRCRSSSRPLEDVRRHRRHPPRHAGRPTS